VNAGRDRLPDQHLTAVSCAVALGRSHSLRPSSKRVANISRFVHAVRRNEAQKRVSSSETVVFPPRDYFFLPLVA
jgi:hypothetical protein